MIIKIKEPNTDEFENLSNLDIINKIEELKELFNSQDEWADNTFGPRTSLSEIQLYKESDHWGAGSYGLSIGLNDFHYSPDVIIVYATIESNTEHEVEDKTDVDVELEQDVEIESPLE